MEVLYLDAIAQVSMALIERAKSGPALAVMVGISITVEGFVFPFSARGDSLDEVALLRFRVASSAP